MKQILTQHELASKILREQLTGNEPFRLSTHVLCVPCEEGELLYNNLTGEILLLEMGETLDMHRNKLKKSRFLVPDDHDEYMIAIQLRQLAGIMAPRRDAITQYVLFPTMDCNARCFYCYELGRKRTVMTEKVAKDTAKYILKKSKDNRIKLQWFGGEPLYNRKVIDIISNYLDGNEVDFHSIMGSNGFLFDKDTIKIASAEWKLEAVQIPLDGCEEVYNRTKTYIYKDVNAYERVMHNIGLLLDEGIKVSVRMNMNMDNVDELWRLSDELKERFGGKDGFSAYTVLLRDFSNEARRYDDEIESLHQYESLQKKLIDDGIGKREYTRRKISINQCMADSENSITILPDGRIGKCEHESEQKLIGSIYEKDFDQSAINAWKERIIIPECRKCLFAPSCIRLKQCDWNTRGCTEGDRAEMMINLKMKVLNTYERVRTTKEDITAIKES